MGTQFKYKNENAVWREKQVDGVLYLEYQALEKLGIVKHGFSARVGGVSEGIFSSMNLSFTRGDDEHLVKENFKRMAYAIGAEVDNLVFAVQTHTTNVRKVTVDDKGKGILRPVDYQDIDGLITNEPGICLTTFYADCVPLFFVDPVHKAIGLSHSGWRGTVGKMGAVTLKKMAEEYGTNPEDVIAGIGPSICQECYEVSEDVIQRFQEQFQEKDWDALYYKKENGRYQLDLWKANEIILLEAGVKKENIAVTNVCTSCNSDLLFSHRVTQGQRGSLAAFMMLKEEEVCC